MENINFTNEVLQEMQNKKEINVVYSKYYYKLYKEEHQDRFRKKSDRINDCLNLWLWDAYHKNKKLDLVSVNRCMDTRFCPNCKKFSLASAIHNLSPHFANLLKEGYKPYLLTLTVPNVESSELRSTIEKMNNSFSKFFKKLSLKIGKGEHGFSERLIQFDAALKVLEITYNKKANTYHPHFHIMVFSYEYDESLFQKNIPGAWSNKRQQLNYNSILDIHMMQLWKMCYDGMRITVENFESMSTDWQDLYLCDIKEMDVNGIYEVMKYTFKDSDIENFNVFKTFFIALERKRIRQGYGLLYNVKVDEEAEGEKLSIEEFLDIEENPEQLLTREIKELITVYQDYEKISRFKAHSKLQNVLENME